MQATQQISQQQKIMITLIDKLCDHLSNQKIKILIDSGFDQWQTITYMKGQQLLQMNYQPQECIVIMSTINANARQFQIPPIFQQEQIHDIVQQAKENQQSFMRKIQEEEINNKLGQINLASKENQIVMEKLKEYPQKQLNQQLLAKGVMMKLKPGEKVNISKATLITLEEKQITRINEIKIEGLQNFYLGHNHIYKIEGLTLLTKLRILKLESNLITKIENLETLQNLQQLILNDNYISRFQNLTRNKKLNFINLSNQKTKNNLTFEQQSCMQLSYSLEKMQCDNCQIRDISNLRYMKVLNFLQMKNNKLEEIGEISQSLGAMERLKYLDFRGNPLTKLPKYRDYIVILSKSLQQLDIKKILPKERQYLVKLYSLKHAKQVKQQKINSKKSIGQMGSKKQIDLTVVKLEQGSGITQKYSHGTDLRGNVAYANTKINKK